MNCRIKSNCQDQKSWKDRSIESLYEPDTCDGPDYELTTESESDIGKDLNKGYYIAFVLILKEDRFPIIEVEEIDVTEEKASYLPKECTADFKWLLRSYQDKIAHSLTMLDPQHARSRTSLN